MFGVGTFAEAPFAAEGGAVNAYISLTGVSATGVVGEVRTGTSVEISGISASALLNSVFVTAKYDALVTGFNLDAQLGEEEIYVSTPVPVTGFGLVTSLNSVVVVANATVELTGVLGTTGLGEAEAFLEKFVYPTGVFGTSVLGTVATSADANVYLTGVSANCRLSPQRVVNVWGLIDTAQTADWTQIPT
jgi:hypothetical protein